MSSRPPTLAGRQLFAISQINRLPRDEMEQVYRALIPIEILHRFSIDPHTLVDEEGRSLFTCRPGVLHVSLVLHHKWNAKDPVFYLQLADTPNNQIEIPLFILNDPHSERYNTDRMPDGTPTLFSTMARNIPEEIRAMEAGLAPGQVRRGLGLSSRLISHLEQFVVGIHHDMFHVQPLAYHNAIHFERLGFAYKMGRKRMQEIHRQFQPGGSLFQRLDGSTPFRRPGMEKTVRGRSWAIHDGILDQPYDGVTMYKRVGVNAAVATFPNAAW